LFFFDSLSCLNLYIFRTNSIASLFFPSSLLIYILDLISFLISIFLFISVYMTFISGDLDICFLSLLEGEFLCFFLPPKPLFIFLTLASDCYTIVSLVTFAYTNLFKSFFIDSIFRYFSSKGVTSTKIYISSFYIYFYIYFYFYSSNCLVFYNFYSVVNIL